MSRPDLGVELSWEDFPEFFRQIHGHDPFPWQSALATAVLSKGRWPSLVDVPTGLGKTSLLDVAVFVAAATAHQQGSARVGRRRCLFVVDRRVVVDEATLHAGEIVERLTAAEATTATSGTHPDTEPTDVLARVAARLRLLGGTRPGEGEVLTVTRMRGGTRWSQSWAERPDRPGIVLSTVDQVGSRLLFRGYGVSERRRSIEAALVGTDALLLVDEAHLATSLLRTLRAIAERDHTDVPLPGLDVVQLTATASRSPGASSTDKSAEWVFPLDLPVHQAVQEANRRLSAAKTLHLMEVPLKKAPAEMARVARVLARPRTSGAERAPVVLVVCNTVNRARAVHDALLTTTMGGADRQNPEVHLLIGRSRPIDRTRREQDILQRFGVAADRTDRAAILVSTQTVEVGVNLDVDALVSETASWDALVQRLGRLNRLGRYQDRFPGTGAALAVVVHDGQQNGPVYGTARDHTWTHLRSLTQPVTDLHKVITRQGGPAGVKVSPAQCRELTAAVPAEAYLADPGSPIVTTPILDRWVCTAPAPAINPPIEAYLHGFGSGSPAVSLTWRAGLMTRGSRIDLDSESFELGEELLGDLLTAAPPRSGEQVEVPLAAVRRWASGQRPGPVSDLEVNDAPDPSTRAERVPFEVLAHRDDPGQGARWRWVSAGQLCPGDVVVVPAERGGLDAYGWNPAQTGPVEDVSEAAATDAGQLLLYLDRSLGERLHLPQPHTATITQLVTAITRRLTVSQDPDAIDDVGVDPGELTRRVLRAVEEGLAAENAGADHVPASVWADPERRDRLRNLVQQALQVREGRRPLPVAVEATPVPSEDTSPSRVPTRILLSWRPPRPVRTTETSSSPAETPLARPEVLDATEDRIDDDPTASSLTPTGTRVTLHNHHRAVRERATRMAENLGLPTDLAQVVADAAGWHDLGKAEERFQAMLHGGDPYAAAIAAEPLAKSGMDPQDRAAWRRARLRSGLPRGARHEAWSVALVARHINEHGYPADTDLLLHLIASHHGHARPLLPLVVDQAPRLVRTSIARDTVQAPSQDTVDLDHPGRFSTLNQRYGRWGLALLEAVVRCADTTVSSEGS